MHKLRAHHLVCMCQFQGLGYNDAFASNMARILDELKKDPSSKITVVTHMDDICAACPNRLSDTICARSKDGCISIDSSVLDALHLTLGQTYSYGEILEHIKENLESVYDVCCKGCSWEQKGVCSFKLLNEYLKL